MFKVVVGIAITGFMLGGAAARADTITNIDLTADYNGSWATAINGANIAAGLASGTGNAGTGLTFDDPTAQYVETFCCGNTPGSVTIDTSIALNSDSVVNGLFNNFFGSTNEEGELTFTNSLGQTASYELIGGETIRDYNNDGFVNTITGANSNPATEGDVTAQLWWYDLTGGTDSPGTMSSPSSRLDAQTFALPADWAGTDLTSVVVTDTDTINADLIMSALQVDAETPTTVPEPASLALFGSALVAFGTWRRRRRSQ